MSPDDIIQKLSLLGVNITRRTLLNYEKWGIIPEPKRGGGGTGGRWTDYPPDTAEEAYTAYIMLNGKVDVHSDLVSSGKFPHLSSGFIANCRGKALAKEEYLASLENAIKTFTQKIDKEGLIGLINKKGYGVVNWANYDLAKFSRSELEELLIKTKNAYCKILLLFEDGQREGIEYLIRETTELIEGSNKKIKELNKCPWDIFLEFGVQMWIFTKRTAQIKLKELV